MCLLWIVVRGMINSTRDISPTLDISYCPTTALNPLIRMGSDVGSAKYKILTVQLSSVVDAGVDVVDFSFSTDDSS